MQTEHSPARLPWRAFLLLLGLLSIVPNLGSLLYFLDAAGQERLRGIDLGIAQIDVLPGWGSCQRIARGVAQGGAFAQAGGRDGDRLCYQRTLELYPYLTTAASINVRVIGVDQRSRWLTLPTTPRRLQSLNWIDGIGQPVQDMLFALVGMLIGWRGAQQRHLRKLSLGMLLWSMLMPFFVPAWAMGALDLLVCASQANLLAFLGFALAAPELRSADAGRAVNWIRRGLPVYGVLCLLGILFSGWTQTAALNGQALLLAETVRLLLTLMGYLALVTVLFVYRALAQGAARERIDLLLPMFCLSLLVQLQPSLYVFVPQARTAALVLMEYLLASLLPLGLGYAVLRHRVFDLGFALNRAIFFSLFTLLLAIAIGFAEFTVKLALHHISWLQQYPVVAPIISALLGIAVILGFRHIHHWLEDLVENLFFHDWHVAAERFRQKTARIANVGAPSVVLERFGQALQEFTPMSGLAILLQPDLTGGRQSGRDDFVLEYGTSQAIATLDANHVLASDLRAGLTMLELEPLDAEKGETALPQARHFRLALALQVRGRLFGIVLLGQKNDCHRYRPDEIKLLSQACDAIALDLENLRVTALQEQHAQQRQEIMQLQAQLEIARLQSALNEATAKTGTETLVMKETASAGPEPATGT